MLLCFASGCDHTSIRPAFKNFRYVCLKMVTLIESWSKISQYFFFGFTWAPFGFTKVFCAASWRSVI